MSNEILTFLNKRPLKQAASTLYSIQKNDGFKKMIGAQQEIPDMEELLETELNFLEYHHEPALSLIPLRDGIRQCVRFFYSCTSTPSPPSP